MLTIWQEHAQRSAGARERVRLPFGRRVRSALRAHVSGCAYHLAGAAQLCGCTRLPFGRRMRSALPVLVSEALTIWQAGAQRCAGARERVCLPFGKHVRSAARAHLSRCACHALAIWQARAQRSAGASQRVCLCTIWKACAQRCAGARERVCLPFGRRVRSALPVNVSGCAYHLAGVCAALCGCT